MLSTGTKVPQFSLNDLDGVPTSPLAMLTRGPVLLAFYKISCPVCQLTLPFLDRLAGAALQIFAISQDDTSATRRFQAKFAVTLPTLLDIEEEGYPVSSAFGITHVPTLFLVEPDGIISLVSEGFVKADLEKIAARAGVPLFGQEETVPAWKAG